MALKIVHETALPAVQGNREGVHKQFCHPRPAGLSTGQRKWVTWHRLGRTDPHDTAVGRGDVEGPADELARCEDGNGEAGEVIRDGQVESRTQVAALSDVANGQLTSRGRADHHVSLRALALAAAGAAVPMLTMERLGFAITGTLAFWLVARAFRSPRPALDLLVGAVLSLVAWWLFGKLGVQLGPLLPLAGV